MSEELINTILACKTYRDLLNTIARKAFDKSLSYSDVARFGGLSSRSLVRDIFIGRRRITLSNINGIIKGLKLDGKVLTLFKLRVHQEEPDLKLYTFSQSVTEKRIKKVLEDLERFSKRIVIEKNRQKEIHLLKNYGQIFAAMVNGESGTSIQTIKSLTGIPIAELKSDLAIMSDQGLVRNISYETFAPTAHFYDFALDIEWSSRKLKLLHSGKKINRLLESLDSYSPNTLFTEATFSIKARDIQPLRERLRSMLSELMIDFEYDGKESTEILNINISLYPEKFYRKSIRK